MDLLAFLDELTDTMKLVAPVATLPLVLMLPWFKPAGLLSNWKRLTALAVLALCCLIYSLGTGSCVLGGFLQGTALCGFRRRGVTWDPVADFYAIQGVWSFVFLLSTFIALLAVLSLLPGTTTGWQRFLFLASAGRRGAWREPASAPDPIAERALTALRGQIAHEIDAARKAEWLAAERTVLKLLEDERRITRELKESRERMEELGRTARVIAWLSMVLCPLVSIIFLVPVIAGALTGETFLIGRFGGTASLEAQPVLFWLNMGFCLAMIAATIRAAFGAARLRRSLASRTSALGGGKESNEPAS